MAATEQKQFQQEVIVGGVRLDIVTCEISEANWQLAVRNSLGIYSVWHELFATPESAIDAALSAIESEGVEEFISVEGFEYLLEE